ncbi:hypothetical protein [Pseudotabrizicola sp. 4114]|uniref:hypothetical protein n=1 Tax=Pseudotabrizicola sp. 4114 TaxID=2817731 RepID=UPI00285B8A1A|nr:CBS domain-containing protein [Pseudorhodobacter sp. 4114]
MRAIVDLPRLFVRTSVVPWKIDWRGQSSGPDTGGGDQTVVSGFPRFVGAVALVLPPEMVLEFRAILTRLRGRVNALRVPMVDPLSGMVSGGLTAETYMAWQAGQYVEPRPKVRVVAAAARGVGEIVVDETDILRPIQIGSNLSYDDRPFSVVGRSGYGATVTLLVERLAVAIPEDAMIDLEARGIFTLDDPLAAMPDYGLDHVAQTTVALTEWITR